jgi:hypothetical protein
MDRELGQAKGDMNARSRFSNSSRMDRGIGGPAFLKAFQEPGVSETA